MKKETIRDNVSTILTELLGDKNNGNIFTPENTIRRSSAGKKMTKYDLKTSASWSASSIGKHSIRVLCIGMTMSEFIQEYKNNNISIFKDNVLLTFNIYKNEPIWNTSGHVKKTDSFNSELTLHIEDLKIDDITIKINEYTPKWLYENPGSLALFDCRIYLWWRLITNINDSDWPGVFKTFKFDHYLTEDELEYYL